MEKKQVTLVALDPRATIFYAQQLKELFGDRIVVNYCSIMDGTITKICQGDVYLISNEAFENSYEERKYIPLGASVVGIQLTFQKSVIQELLAYPTGTKALFVNLNERMSREAITQLNQLGVNQIEFIPFYPGGRLKTMCDLVITPDEERYVPVGFGRLVNIGHRYIASATMIELALRLGMEDLLEESAFLKYMGQLALDSYNFNLMFSHSRRLESQFEILMETLDEGIIGVNELGEVFACNHKAEDITKTVSKLILNCKANEVFPYIPFLQCMQIKKQIPPKVISILGTNVNIVVTPVIRRDECLGAFAVLQLFNDAEIRQNELRKQLRNKGHFARYTFNDVIGKSPAICHTIEILKRMAKTSAPILLIGETGTGKELFAHSIHNESSRKANPFVAINCGAMPESLMESELFGYEEGAFTGARRGGCPGLFEFAHQGTLFLDEVEGMSLPLQVKLLRVLQEGEVMRVGGDRLIRVDVRIIAATNEELEAKVRNGCFRKDLYYRLNTLPVLIPPLRERGDDLLLLVDTIAEKVGGNFVLSPEVIEAFKHHPWDGNVRELRNVVEYLTYTGQKIIKLEDLPTTFWEDKTIKEGTISPKTECSGSLDCWLPASCRDIPEPLCRFVLHQLYLAGKKGRGIGRSVLMQQAGMQELHLSQRQVKKILSALEGSGLAQVERGRGGSRITFEGSKLWKSINDKI